MKSSTAAPTWALLFGAATWGVVWYPYRVLAHGGLDGVWSTLVTYATALVIGMVLFPRAAMSLVRMPALALLMGASIGWSNLAYVVAVLDGEVMRVLLLFYLAPLWTVPLAHLLLHERLDRQGFLVMALAFAGAMIMLWKPETGLPFPRGRAEWLGLVAGFLFALGNVLVRKLDGMGDAAKSIVIWAGVTVAALVHLPMSHTGAGEAMQLAWNQGLLVLVVGIALLAMSLALQYGLSRLPANRAIVILLFELVVAAVAAYLLAGEALRPGDWVGGVLIVAASIAAGRQSSR